CLMRAPRTAPGRRPGLRSYSSTARAGATVSVITMAASTASPYASVSGCTNVAASPCATTIGTTVTRTMSVAYAIGVRTAAEAASTRTADDSSLPSARRARTVRAISAQPGRELVERFLDGVGDRDRAGARPLVDGQQQPRPAVHHRVADQRLVSRDHVRHAAEAGALRALDRDLRQVDRLRERKLV